jgi:hypothetical protein
MFRRRIALLAFKPRRSCAIASRMDLPLTLALAAACLAFAVLCGWRGGRPPDPSRGPRLVPWRLLMVLSAGGALPFVVHLVNLLGMNTGR